MLWTTAKPLKTLEPHYLYADEIEPHVARLDQITNALWIQIETNTKN